MARGRRGNGEGSLYRDEARNRWIGQITIDGKRRSVYGPTREAVRLKLTAMARDRDRGVAIANGTGTVADYLRSWLQQKTGLEASTCVGYEQVIRLYLIPGIGMHKLAKLSPYHVQSFYTAIQARQTIGSTRARLIHAVLHAALNDAVRLELVPRNVSSLVEKPQRNKPEMHVYDAEQVRVLLPALTGDRHEAVYLLALNTGMRLGELLALHWRDVDLTCGMVHLQRSWKRTANGYAEGKVKTDESRRTIRLTQTAIEMLRTQHTRQIERRLAAGRAWCEHDLLFSRDDGTHLSHAQVQHHWPLVLRRAGLPYIRLHDLRHTFATLLLKSGVPVKVVSEMLGHSTIRITLDIYAHVLPDMQADAVVTLDSLLSNQASRSAGEAGL